MPVRTRDSAERLDQVYRRLLADTPAIAGPHAPARPAAHPCPINQDDPAMRIALYARVSTERQERQQTIDSQLAVNRH